MLNTKTDVTQHISRQQKKQTGRFEALSGDLRNLAMKIKEDANSFYFMSEVRQEQKSKPDHT